VEDCITAAQDRVWEELIGESEARLEVVFLAFVRAPADSAGVHERQPAWDAELIRRDLGDGICGVIGLRLELDRIRLAIGEARG
jgi:hypothetical protein